MSIFSNIMNKIFHHSTAQAQRVPEPATAGAMNSPQPAPNFSPSIQNIDVGAVLDNLAQAHAGGGNYKSSIVDLLKLLDLDSSLDARKKLAQELNVHVGADGSAEENLALHKAVMQKLAENGGIVPASLRD